MVNIEITDAVTERLLALAICRHGKNIEPCSGRATFRECVTEGMCDCSILVLWYNDDRHSTHVVKIKKEELTTVSDTINEEGRIQ